MKWNKDKEEKKPLTVAACRWYTLLDSLSRLPLLKWELPIKDTEALTFWAPRKP